MEIGVVAQRHKLALLQDMFVAQLRKQNLVNRPFFSRKEEDHQIKATPGITGLSGPRVHIDGPVWHLDVGSAYPGAGEGPKGWAVRPLKRHASWVQTVWQLLLTQFK